MYTVQYSALLGRNVGIGRFLEKVKGDSYSNTVPVCRKTLLVAKIIKTVQYR